MTIKEAILAQMQLVAERQKKTLAPLTDDLKLLESGLDSLCLAILVAALDDTLDIDPFSAGTSKFPVTLGEFVQLYESHAG